MKVVRNTLLAFGLVGAGATGHAVITQPATLPNECNAPWVGKRQDAPPSEFILEADSHLIATGFIVCTHPDGSEITMYDNGTEIGFGPNGETITHPREYYEAHR